DGVVGGTSFAEGLNAGKTLGDGISNWPCGRKSRSLAFGAVGKGEARPALLKGLKPARRSPLSKPLARTQNKPFVLNPANRRIRTRTYGGVGGEEPRGSPYPDWSCLIIRGFSLRSPIVQKSDRPRQSRARGRRHARKSAPARRYVALRRECRAICAAAAKRCARRWIHQAYSSR